MSKGTPALIAWLGVVTFLMLVVYVIVLWIAGAAPESWSPDFGHVFWQGLMRMMDAGTMGGDEGSWAFLIINYGVTLGGVFILSTLIGVLSSGLESRLDALRKGRSRVVEENHVLILGWSPTIFTVLSELMVANANRKGACIVILADKDKVEMEDEIRERVSGPVRVVCRSGSPMDPVDLNVVSVQASRSIVILSPEEEDADISVIKSLLAITNAPDRRPEPYHIVAEIREPANLEAARMVGKDEVELVLGQDLIARITVQTCRQSGLSVVHTELLDFGGDEIYFKADPALTGKTFGEALSMFEDSAIIGIARGGKVQVLPPMDTRIESGDEVIAVSADDDTVKVNGKPSVNAALIQAPQPTTPAPERTLILGWNWRAPSIIKGLDAYVAPGSAVTLVCDKSDVIDTLADEIGTLERQTLQTRFANPTTLNVLESLSPEDYNHIIVLCGDDEDPQKADARVLLTLLHLREMGDRLNRDFSIVSEMRDVRNRQLAEVTRADDFIVSDRLVSLLLCQIAENKRLNSVFTDLFDPDGAEIYIKPITGYVKPGVEVNFYTLVEAARQRGEAAMGYWRAEESRDANRGYGVHVNPPKSAMVRFSEADRLIVVADS